MSVSVSGPLELHCRACGATIVLDAVQQEAIMAELRMPAQRKLIECVCGHFQFALAAQPVRKAAAQ